MIWYKYGTVYLGKSSFFMDDIKFLWGKCVATWKPCIYSLHFLKRCRYVIWDREVRHIDNENWRKLGNRNVKWANNKETVEKDHYYKFLRILEADEIMKEITAREYTGKNEKILPLKLNWKTNVIKALNARVGPSPDMELGL